MEQYIVKAKNIIAGRKLQVLQNAAVEVKDGKIEEIYESETQIPEELKDKVTDLGDVTLMPGMIDCHNHLALDTRLENHLIKMNDCECEQTIRALKTMKDDLEAGVTTSRCMGDRYYIDAVSYTHLTRALRILKGKKEND